jgi:PrtD family type I secretion system ABC transporter
VQTEPVRILGTNRGVLVSALFFSCLVNLLMLTGPLFMRKVYDRVLSTGSIPTLVALGAIVVVLYAYFGFLDFVRTRLLARIGRRIEGRFRHRLFDALSWHSLRRTPGVGSQPMNDLATVRQFLSGQAPFAFLDLPWLPVYLGVIFLMHWLLGVVAGIAALFIFLLAIIQEFAIRRSLEEATAASLKASLITDECRLNAEALHGLGMIAAMRARWAEVSQLAMDRQTTSSDLGGGLGALSRVLRLMIQSAVLGLGAFLAIQQEISVGTIVAATVILSRALAPIEQAVGNWQLFLSYRKAIKRLNSVLQTMPVEVTRTKLPKPHGKLEAENVVVQVPEIEKPLLQGVSFTVQPGEGLAVIGPTGAGKSTLARALVGVIPATRGHVRLDGSTLDQHGRDELGRLIGYLPQDVQLFQGTIAENIARFTADPSAEAVVNAAMLANVHEMIQQLPNGYETQVGGSGSRLSGGQRQRIALARALYGDPVMLVFDEPNSFLDADGEAALDQAIRHSLSRGASVVIVAHRPSGLSAIQRVLVLNDGKPAALGNKDEVLRKVLVRSAPDTAKLPSAKEVA